MGGKFHRPRKPYPVPSRVGKWTVHHPTERRGAGANWFWKVVCDCGTAAEVNGSLLRTGKSTQCKSCRGRQNGRAGLNSKSKGDLYVLKCGPYFKVGSASRTVEKRVRDMASANPYKIEIHRVLKGEAALEGELLEFLAEEMQPIHGEWFKAGQCDII